MKVGVVGLGGPGVTVVPSVTEKDDGKGVAHFTTVQQTPTLYFVRPAKDVFANFLRKIRPEKLAYKITRFKNVRLQDIGFRRAREKPEKVKEFLTKRLKAALGDRYDPVALTPPYNPWDQRLCLVPDADFLEVMKAGKASVVTDHIERFDKGGIQLKSGQPPADENIG